MAAKDILCAGVNETHGGWKENVRGIRLLGRPELNYMVSCGTVSVYGVCEGVND